MFRRWFALSQEEWDLLIQEVPCLKELEEQITQRVSLEEVSVEKNKELLALIVRAQEELKKSSSNLSARLEHELEGEHFWVEWRELLELQSHLCKEWVTQKEQAQLNTLIKKEKRLLKLFSHIVTHKAFAELHAHISASLSDDDVWKWFKEQGVCVDWVQKREDGGWPSGFSKEDAIQLNILVRELCEGRVPEKELYKRFLAVIRQKHDEKIQGFKQFIEKSDIVCVLHDRALFSEEDDNKRIEEYERLFLRTMRSYAQEGVDYLESRGRDNKDFRLKFEGARRAQQKFSACTLKIIPMFTYGTNDEEKIMGVKKQIDEIYDLLEEYGDVVAGFDIIESSSTNEPHEFVVIKYICEKNKTRSRKLNITTHIGEYFSENNWEGANKYGAFKTQLTNVERVLEYYGGGLRRLGHANVLGVDCNKYFDELDIKRREELIVQQERIIEQIIKLGVCIETNPTSNKLIAGVLHKESTAVQLMKKAFKIKEKKGLHKPVLVTINTDDRVIFGGRLLQEFLRVAYHADLSEEAVDELRANAHKCYLDKM